MVTFTPASDIWTLGYDQFDNICWRHKKTQGLYYIPPGQPLTLPPRRLTNMICQNVSNTLPHNATATACAEVPSLQGLGELIHFNKSILRASETAKVWPAIVFGHTQSHPLPMSRPEDGNQCLSPRSLEIGPRWNFSNYPYCTTPATVCAEASPHQGLSVCQSHGLDKGAHIDNSVLEVPEAVRLQPASILESTKLQTLPPMSTTDKEKQGLPSKSLANAPLPSLRPEPDLTAATKDHARSSLLPGNVRRNNFESSSEQGVSETARLWPAVIKDDTPHPPTQTLTPEVEKNGLPPMSSANAPLPNLSPECHLIPTTKDHDREPLLPGGVEEENFDINSTLDQPDVTRVQTAACIVDDIKSQISPPLSKKAEKTMIGSTPRSLAIAPENHSRFPATAERVGTCLPPGDDEQGHPSSNSASELPEAVGVQTVSVEDTKSRIYSVPRAGNTERGLSPEISENIPCSDTLEDPTLTPASTTRADASLILEDGEGDLFDSNSSPNVPEARRVWPVSIVDTIPHPCHPISRTEEAEQWCRERDIRGKEYYVNIITGKTQYKKPDCLKKYTSRR